MLFRLPVVECIDNTQKPVCATGEAAAQPAEAGAVPASCEMHGQDTTACVRYKRKGKERKENAVRRFI